MKQEDKSMKLAMKVNEITTKSMPDQARYMAQQQNQWNHNASQKNNIKMFIAMLTPHMEFD